MSAAEEGVLTISIEPDVRGLRAPVDEALVERAAEAAYVGVMTQKGEASLPFMPWTAEPGDTRRGELPDYFKRNWRAAARAVLEVIA